MRLEISLTKEQRFQTFKAFNQKSDRISAYVLVAYFIFGLLVAFFYDTWFVAFGVGGVCLAACFICRVLVPDSTLGQYVMSVALALFSAQFIYQMHGLFEMHFFFFVGPALLI